MTSPPSVLLHRFKSSHFNEKARWAPDFKDVEHQHDSYLPREQRELSSGNAFWKLLDQQQCQIL